jgi:hypothetical protein
MAVTDWEKVWRLSWDMKCYRPPEPKEGELAKDYFFRALAHSGEQRLALAGIHIIAYHHVEHDQTSPDQAEIQPEGKETREPRA